MPTIAYLAGQFPLRSETFVYREVRELRRRGWKVVCVSLRSPTDPPSNASDLTDGCLVAYERWIESGILEILGSPVRSFRTLGRALCDAFAPGESTSARAAAQLPLQAIAAQSLARRLRLLGVQHVHCHFAHAPATVGMYAARQLGVSFSFTGHANDLYQRRMLLRRKLERAAFVSCISGEHREFYRSIHERAATAYPVIRAGVDVDDFSGVPPAGTTRSCILTVCRLVEKKGVDALLCALAKLPPATSLTIAGDGPERRALERLAKELRIDHRTKFMGSVSNEMVRELLRTANIFALPCRVDRHGDKDGIPVVLMEAMACGVPVVAGDLPAIRELVIHRRTGFLVDGADPSAVAAALQELLGDGPLADGLAREARRYVVDEFSLKVNVDRLERSLKGAIKDHASLRQSSRAGR